MDICNFDECEYSIGSKVKINNRNKCYHDREGVIVAVPNGAKIDYTVRIIDGFYDYVGDFREKVFVFEDEMEVID